MTASYCISQPDVICYHTGHVMCCDLCIQMDDDSSNMTSFFTESLPADITNRSVEYKTGDSGQQNIKIIVNEIYFYLLGVIIPLGLVCNSFCVLVCALSVGLRRTSTGHYLMALAIADSLFLSADLVRWMNTTSAREARYTVTVY